MTIIREIISRRPGSDQKGHRSFWSVRPGAVEFPENHLRRGHSPNARRRYRIWRFPVSDHVHPCPGAIAWYRSFLRGIYSSYIGAGIPFIRPLLLSGSRACRRVPVLSDIRTTEGPTGQNIDRDRQGACPAMLTIKETIKKDTIWTIRKRFDNFVPCG